MYIYIYIYIGKGALKISFFSHLFTSGTQLRDGYTKVARTFLRAITNKPSAV